MTRARLIEDTIRGWLMVYGDFDYVSDGVAEAPAIVLKYAELAKEIDRELDRIIREAKS